MHYNLNNKQRQGKAPEAAGGMFLLSWGRFLGATRTAGEAFFVSSKELREVT